MICQIHNDRHYRSISASPQYCAKIGCCDNNSKTETHSKRTVALNVPLLIPLGSVVSGKRSF